MTEAELNEIEARVNAATPGPWKHTPGDSYCAYPHVNFGSGHYLFEDHSSDECNPHCEKPGCGFPSGEFNAEFIARSRIDIPLLIAEVRKWEEAKETFLAEHDENVRLYFENVDLKEKNAKLVNALETIVYYGKDRHPNGGDTFDCDIAQEALNEVKG